MSVDAAISQVRNPSIRKRLESLGRTIDQNAIQNDQACPAVAFKPPLYFKSLPYDIPIKDGVGLMDIAVFRLAKSQARAGETLSYHFAGSIVQVKAGPDGMASVYDYDIVLMMISHLNEAVKRYRRGKAKMPSNRLTTTSAAIFAFCGHKAGGATYKALEGALDRLQGTTIKITDDGTGKNKRRTGYFPLLAGAEIISETKGGSPSSLELIIPDWIFEGVLKCKRPDVLTVSPDYFKLKQGLARFIYRLARKSAGSGKATYGFRSIYERSGSSREFKKFKHDLKTLVRKNHLPDYSLSQKDGRSDVLLVMRSR